MSGSSVPTPPTAPPARLPDVADVQVTQDSFTGLHNTTVLSPDRIERYRRSRFNAIRGLSPERLVQYMSDWNAGYLRYMAITMEQIMQRDPTFQTVVPKRMSDASRENWTIQILDGHEKDTEALAQKDTLQHFYSNLRVTSAIDRDVVGGVELAVGQMVRHGVGMKYCCHEILWRQNMNGLTAVLNHVPGWFFEARTGKLRFLMEDFAWDGVPMNTTDPMADSEKMDIASWMISVGPGIMEAGSVLYLYGMYAMRDWADYSEQRGKPLIKGHTKAPMNSERHQAMQRLLAALGPNNPILMGPKEEEDVDVLQTAAAGPLAPQTLYETMEKRKTSLWRGGDLSTTSAGQGEAGQGASLQQGETTNVKEGDLLWASNNFRFQLDPLIIRITRGPNVPVLAYFTLGGADKSNAALEVQVDQFLVGAGFPVSVTSAAERYNRPIPGPDEQLLTAPQPQSRWGGGGEEQPPPGPDDGTQPPEDPQEPDGTPDSPFGDDSGANLGDDEGPFGNLLANSRQATRKLVGEAARRLGVLKAKSFKPVADALMDAYNEEDGDKMVAKLKQLRAQLPDMLKRINRNPQSAKVFEDTMGTALVQGVTGARQVANSGTTAGAIAGWITRHFGTEPYVAIDDGDKAGTDAASAVGGKHQHTSTVNNPESGRLKVHRITHDDPEMAGMVLETNLRRNGYNVMSRPDKLGAVHVSAQPLLMGKSAHHFVLYTPDLAANELEFLATVEECYANEGTTDGALKGWETRRHGSAMQVSAKAFESGSAEDHEAAAKAHEGVVRGGDSKRAEWARQHRETAAKIREEAAAKQAELNEQARYEKVKAQGSKADELSATAGKASDATVETNKGHSDAAQAHRLAGDAHSRIYEEAKRKQDTETAAKHYAEMRLHRAMEQSHKFLAGEKGDRPLKQAKSEVSAAFKVAQKVQTPTAQFKLAEAQYVAATSARDEKRPQESKAYAAAGAATMERAKKAKGGKKAEPSKGKDLKAEEKTVGGFKIGAPVKGKDKSGKPVHYGYHVTDAKGNRSVKTVAEVKRMSGKSKANEGGQSCGAGYISGDKQCHAGQGAPVAPKPAQFATSQSRDAHEFTRKAWASGKMEDHFAAKNAHEAAARAREDAGDAEGAKMHKGLADKHSNAVTQLAFERFLKKKPAANEWQNEDDDAALRQQIADYLGLDANDPELEAKAEQAYEKMGQGEDNPDDDGGSGPGQDGAPQDTSDAGVSQGTDAEPDDTEGSQGSNGEPDAVAAAPDNVAQVDPAGKPPELMDFAEFQASQWSDPEVLGITVTNTGQLGAQHKSYIAVAITERKPVLKRMADYYGVAMPVGYQEVGENYEWQTNAQKGEAAESDADPALMDFPEFKESPQSDSDKIGFEAKGDLNLMSAHRALVEAAFTSRSPVSKKAADRYGTMGLKLPQGYRQSDDGERYEWSKDATAQPPKVWAQERVQEFFAETEHERAEDPDANIVVLMNEDGKVSLALEPNHENQDEDAEESSFVEGVSEGRANEEWSEEEHPRDAQGRFAKSAAFALKLGFEPIRRVGDSPKEVTVKGKTVTKMVGGKWVMARTGEDLPEHLQKVPIPPAWKNAYANPKAEGKYLAVGMDSKGRIAKSQTPAFVEHQKQIKFARMNELKAVKEEIFAQTKADTTSPDHATREAASCLRVIQDMGLRPGSTKDTKAAKQAYGATTLQGRHVVEPETEGAPLRLKFTGKKGVALSLPVRNPEIAAMLRERAAVAGRKGNLFDTSEGKLLEYTHTLGGGGFTPKDFRTLKGTEVAIEEIDKVSKPKTFKDYKRKVMDVADRVSRVLGNTRVIALQSYIDPSVFLGWKVAEV